MKRWKIWVAASALSMAIAAGSGAASAEETMMAKPDYSKVEVMMKDGMDWVPLRQIAESLGYTVTWNDADRSITLSMPKTAMGMTDKSMTDKKDMMDAYVVILRIGSMKVTAGGKESDLTFAPAIWTDKTYVTKTFVESMLVSSTMK